MHILFLDQFSELGGAQRCLLDLLPAIEQRGWRASAAIPPGGPLVAQVRARNVSVSDIRCGPYRSGAKSLADLLRFPGDVQSQVRAIQRQNFDLLYINGPRLLPAAALALHNRAPVVFHAHSSIPPGAQKWMADWSLRHMHAVVIACSRSVAPPVENLRVISNGTEDLGFLPRTFQSRRIGIVGRISPEKGQAEFLRAAAILATEFPDSRFIICGAPIFPSGNYDQTVRKLAAGLTVDFLGWREDVAAVLADLDLLVIPSRKEGMPRVLLEAFSAGLPVVAFPAGGIPDAITDRETGFLVPEATPEALAARIREILRAGPESLQRVAANARRAWERSYTLAIYQKSVTDLLENLVSDWRAGRETAAPPART